MSTRPSPAPPEGGSKNRLSAVLAAGIEQVSIDAKAKQLDRKLARANKPKLEGVTKPQRIKTPDSVIQDVIEQALKQAQAKEVTMEQELPVLIDCFEFVGSFLPCNYSSEGASVIACLGAVRYFEHTGICASDLAGYFYVASNTYLAYLQIKDDLPSSASRPVATGSLFDDATRGQIRRQVFADQSITTLMMDYFGDLRNFIEYVNAGDWAKVREVVYLMLPSLLNTVFAMGGYLPGSVPGAAMLSELNANYSRVSSQGNVATVASMFATGNWFPRGAWASQASNIFRVGNAAGATASRLGGALWDIVSTRNIGGGLASIVMGGENGGRVMSNFQELVLIAWRYDTIFLSGPIGRICFNLAAILTRALTQATLYQIDSVKKYITVNSREEAGEWGAELQKAADLKVGLTPAVKAQRKRLVQAQVEKWRDNHKPLAKRIKKRRIPRVRRDDLIGRIVNMAGEAQAAAEVAFQLTVWKAGVRAFVDNVDEAVTEMNALQTAYTEADMIAARQAVVAERAADAARGVAPPAEEEESSDDDDGAGDEEQGRVNIPGDL